MMRKLLLFFLSWKLLVFAGSFLATLLAPLQVKFVAGYDFGLRLPYFLWIWANFDGMHYLEIARNWYHHLEYPFFPLLPLIIRSVFQFFDIFKIYVPYLTIGVIFTNLAFLASLFVVSRIINLDKQKTLTPLLFLILLTYPTSFFYGAVYNDSLFFLLSSLTLLFSRKRNFLVASIFGGLATLTRLNGLALVFLIVFEYIGTHWDIKKIISETKSKLHPQEILKSRIYFIILIPLAFIGYLYYIQYLSGNWQDLFTAMKVWNQSDPTFPLQVVYRYLKIFLTVSPAALVFWVAAFEALSVLFYVAMLIFSFKKIRVSYWVFFAVSILIPSLTGTFAGMPRYGLHIYPFFLSIAIFLQDKPSKFKLAYFAISLAFFLFAITLFTRGYFVS